jgi:hypothetical protein
MHSTKNCSIVDSIIHQTILPTVFQHVQRFHQINTNNCLNYIHKVNQEANVDFMQPEKHNHALMVEDRPNFRSLPTLKFRVGSLLKKR